MSIPPESRIQTSGPISHILSSTLYLALGVVDTACAALVLLLDRPDKVAASFCGCSVDGFTDAAAGRLVFWCHRCFARSAGIRFGATSWCSGDLPRFDFGFEVFGPFADFAKLAFDGIVGSPYREYQDAIVLIQKSSRGDEKG